MTIVYKVVLILSMVLLMQGGLLFFNDYIIFLHRSNCFRNILYDLLLFFRLIFN
ncbi:putative membrane protein [Candidatus Ichthyocystis hellenicum]|uniref:Putative membrane protein n=1 Tax=Candidatus Ichthyocystis hellenicum TaxID=1561003 RepID=A0A0S4M4N0_9BURK|nr:putative membrane protein [Candidatus Ichthyocystis hellenicum]